MKTIRALRLERGLSQAALAEALGTVQGQVSHWETGKAAPSPKYHYKLAQLFGVEMEEIALPRWVLMATGAPVQLTPVSTSHQHQQSGEDMNGPNY